MKAVVAVVVACVLATTGSACRKADEKPVVRLDGSARVPDDEGVATALSFTSVTLDGKRTYPVSPDLISFSTYTGAVEPMITRKGQYVQIGLRREHGKKAMVWMAGIARVIETTPPAVYYTGTFARTDAAGRAVFRDGTVIRLGPGVQPPAKAGTGVIVRIDPATHLAVEVTTGGGGAGGRTATP